MRYALASPEVADLARSALARCQYDGPEGGWLEVSIFWDWDEVLDALVLEGGDWWDEELDALFLEGVRHDVPSQFRLPLGRVEVPARDRGATIPAHARVFGVACVATWELEDLLQRDGVSERALLDAPKDHPLWHLALRRARQLVAAKLRHQPLVLARHRVGWSVVAKPGGELGWLLVPVWRVVDADSLARVVIAALAS